MADRITAADLKSAVAATVTLHLADGTTRRIPIGAGGPYRLGIDLSTERKPIETFESDLWRTYEPSPHLGVQITLAGAWLTEPAEERATALDHHDWARDARFAAEHPDPSGVPTPPETLSADWTPDAVAGLFQASEDHRYWDGPMPTEEGDETVMIQLDNRSGRWIPGHPGTVDVSEHVDGPIERVDRD